MSKWTGRECIKQQSFIKFNIYIYGKALNFNWAQLFEGQLALKKFNADFFFLCSKAFSWIIFSVIFRASNHQLVYKKNEN